MYIVYIRKNETGEIRQCLQNIEWEDHSLFWWTEGNMGCDCNRELEFERRSENADDIEPYCSDGRFTVLKATFPDERTIAIEEVYAQ